MIWRDFGIGAIDYELRKMQREIDRVLGAHASGVEAGFPPVNAYADNDEVLVTCELPGVGADGVDISVDGNTLNLTVERKSEEASEGEKYHRRERKCGKFSRKLAVPFQIDAGKVTAKMSKGILYLVLPKAETEKPRKIQIAAA